MTEDEWLKCRRPQSMLSFLGEKVSERQLRLFGCACCRRLWDQIGEADGWSAVEVSERFADGLASADDLEQAQNAVEEACTRTWAEYERSDRFPLCVRHAALVAVTYAAAREFLDLTAMHAAQVPAYHKLQSDVKSDRWRRLRREEHAAQAVLLRDIVGNPWRPPAVDPAWVTPSVLAVARAVYDDRILPSGELDLARLAILSDALEEAGCADADLLEHLRSPGPHVRGCRALDLILEKSQVSLSHHPREG